jgi:hypothetical protein
VSRGARVARRGPRLGARGLRQRAALFLLPQARLQRRALRRQRLARRLALAPQRRAVPVGSLRSAQRGTEAGLSVGHLRGSRRRRGDDASEDVTYVC